MAIVAIPLEKSRSVVEYFEQSGRVEVPRPQECPYELCGLKEPLRKNGSYGRQVLYWGLFFLVQILRFRCKRCGRTASCPYGWLVPYHRFSAEVIAAGIKAYSSEELTYRDVSVDLSDLDLAEPELDTRGGEYYVEAVNENAARQPGAQWQPVVRPSRATVYYWMRFVCERAESSLTQVQRELVQEKKRGKEIPRLPNESLVENPNAYKAASAKKQRTLNLSSYLTCVAKLWLQEGKQVWYGLRAYFLRKAEFRKDILTDTRVWLPITHTFEQAIF